MEAGTRCGMIFFPRSFTSSLKVSFFQVRVENNVLNLERARMVEASRHGGLVQRTEWPGCLLRRRNKEENII